MVPSVVNPEQRNVLHLKPGVCQEIAMHASPSANTFFLAPMSAFPRNKIARPAGSMLSSSDEDSCLVELV